MAIIGEVPGEDLNRIVIRFPDVLFSMLMYQNEYIVGSGVILGLVSFLSWISLALMNIFIM